MGHRNAPRWLSKVDNPYSNYLEVILKCYTDITSAEGARPTSVTEGDWRQMERLVRSAVSDRGADESKRLSQMLHTLAVQKELLHHKNKGLKEALVVKKKHRKASKLLDLQQREEYYGGANFWSLQKIREARAYEAVKAQEEHQEMLAKANRKELKAAAKLYKDQIAEEKRVAREEAKVVQEEVKAKKAADRTAKIKAQNTKKATQTSQLGKRRASKASPSNNKRQKCSGVCGGVALSSEAALAAPPKVNSCGRTIKVPTKYR
ncbi:hypothetical protein CC86DRAFT_448156 [Ophiobolus disseminans]|uniref:Uncharacterized protein n=1 Tax=Ophiobolus disseminans TaxID=1469910 RepID=A0A6A6ZPU1_9PLEO|nr:hypothetical protein CC86DRAFT_448156 [Ophiobolus disseminans]